MAYFIVERAAHVTFYKYLVQADDREDAADAEGEYLGYVDAEWTDGPEDEISAAYDTEAGALADELAYTEGTG